MFNRIAIIFVSLIFLSGCAALPPFLSYLSYTKTAADAISYLATKKSTTDHLMSAAMEKDCAMHRALKNEEVCVDYDSEDNFETN